MENSIELLNLPKKAAVGQFFNLNDYAKSRLLYDMLMSIKLKCKLSPDYIILVMDEYSTSLISSFCSMFDLMEAGNVYQIEKIDKFRKRYPMSDVIYLVEPVPASINKIIQDFPEQDEKYSYDHYGDVHLCFLTTIPNEQLDKIFKAPKLVQKVKTFYEVNLDFTVWQDNIFKILVKNNSMMKMIDKPNQTIIEQLSHKLFSLCSVMNERPFIQYQVESSLAEEVAINLYKKIEYLYNYSGTEENSQQIQYREPRGTLLIMDRTFDLISPLVHDYHYQSVSYDYLKIPEDGCLDSLIKIQESDQRQAASEASKKLDEQDLVWQKYKSLHIAEVFGFLQDEIKQLKQDQTNMKRLADKEELHHDDIQKILKQIPEFEKRKTQVLIHLDLAQQVTDKMQNPKFNVMKLIEFEQTIISGMNDQGQKMNDNFITKELMNILKTLGRAEDKLRILSVYLLCYALPEPDFKTVLKLMDTKEQRDVLKFIRDYNSQEIPKKPKRTYPVLSGQEFTEYKRKYTQEIQEMYDILRTQPQIVKIAKEALNKSLDLKAFPFMGDEKQQQSQRNAKWAKKDGDADDERLIICVLGGLSHYEICCLQNLEKINGQQNIIIGSTQIITAREFIDNIVPQKREEDKQKDKAANEDEEEVFKEMEKIKQKRQNAKQKKAGAKKQPDQKRGQRRKTTEDDDEDDDQDGDVNDQDSDDDENKKYKKQASGKSVKSKDIGKKPVLSSKGKKGGKKEAVDLDDIEVQNKSDSDNDDEVDTGNKRGNSESEDDEEKQKKSKRSKQKKSSNKKNR